MTPAPVTNTTPGPARGGAGADALVRRARGILRGMDPALSLDEAKAALVRGLTARRDEAGLQLSIPR